MPGTTLAQANSLHGLVSVDPFHSSGGRQSIPMLFSSALERQRDRPRPTLHKTSQVLRSAMTNRHYQ